MTWNKYRKIVPKWLRSFQCSLLGHNYMAYDFGVDKCLCCEKETYDKSSDLSFLQHGRRQQ